MQTLDEYLDAYGGHLARRCRERLKPLHDPQGPPHPRVKDLLRQPFEAQAHVITGAAKLLERSKTAFLICEMGTGKSLMGIGTVHAHADGKPYRALVFCPGQLVGKWQREIRETLPNVTTQAISNWKEAVALLAKKGTAPKVGEWYVIARDRAKLGAKWRPAVIKARRRIKTQDGQRVMREVNTCPTCGIGIADEEGLLIPLEILERKPHYCGSCKGRSGRIPATCAAGRPRPLFTRSLNASLTISSAMKRMRRSPRPRRRLMPWAAWQRHPSARWR